MFCTVAASESIAGSRTAKIYAFSLSLPAIADFDSSKKRQSSGKFDLRRLQLGGRGFFIADLPQ
ncbi:MAG: hypothetical protein V7K89_26680 [Nostoc sp.]|uniref:hypothetical protein n=1 Tax=Nostoc sp. TaxID=1180 RepID=UPI002FF717BC